MTIDEKKFKITVECLPEDMRIEGNASAIDDETDRQIADNIREQLANGNDWAWCIVRVRAEYKGLRADSYLGGCSYKSREDFMLPGGYYDDMRAEVIADLSAQIETIAAEARA